MRATLDADGIARAVVESVAENTSDAVVGTLFWGLACGPAGVAAYRAANTLDAMVGHRSPRYERFGWARGAARRRARLAGGACRRRADRALRVARRGATWRVLRRDGGRAPEPERGPDGGRVRRRARPAPGRAARLRRARRAAPAARRRARPGAGRHRAGERALEPCRGGRADREHRVALGGRAPSSPVLAHASARRRANRDRHERRAARLRHALGRRQVRRHRRPVPLAATARRLGRAVQGAEHGAELGRDARAGRRSAAPRRSRRRRPASSPRRR